MARPFCDGFAVARSMWHLMIYGAAFAWRAKAAKLNRSHDCFLTAAARFEKFWTLADYEDFLIAGGNHVNSDDDGDEMGFRHVMFVVKASKKRADFAVQMERSWLSEVGLRIYVVDEIIPGIPVHVQVDHGSGNGWDTPDALKLSRLEIWLAWYSTQTMDDMQVRWLVIVGDDAFVNIKQLYNFLHRYPYDGIPVAFSHILSNMGAQDFDMPCVDNALVLNRAAVRRIAVNQNCKECPFVGSDGIALGYCLNFNAVPLVHVPLIHCHTPQQGNADAMLTADVDAHGWIATGGLSQSNLVGQVPTSLAIKGPLDLLPDCRKIYDGTWWIASFFFDFIFACEPQRVWGGQGGVHVQKPDLLVDEDELGADTIDDYFDRRRQATTFASDEPTERAGLNRASLLEAAVAEGWSFVASPDTWCHRSEVARHLAPLRSSAVFRKVAPAGALFAFVSPKTATIELNAGLLLNAEAARALAGSWHFDQPLNISFLEAIGVRWFHQPLMIPRINMIPRDLRGMVNEGIATGAWTIGQVPSWEIMGDLEDKIQYRLYFKTLLQENFEDLIQSRGGGSADGLCGDGADGPLRLARSGMQFLHEANMHRQVLQNKTWGYRDIRAHHAMYRSEASQSPPDLGQFRDAILVARACP